MIVVSFIDKQGKEYSQSFTDPSKAEIFKSLAEDNGCKTKLISGDKGRTILEKGK